MNSDKEDNSLHIAPAKRKQMAICINWHDFYIIYSHTSPYLIQAQPMKLAAKEASLAWLKRTKISNKERKKVISGYGDKKPFYQ